MLRVDITISGDVDSLMLWKLIEKYKVNLFAGENKVWVYGDIELYKVGDLVAYCVLFGDVEAQVRARGVDASGEKKEKS